MLTFTQLEHLMPFFAVLRVERIPTMPSLGNATALVTAFAGFVIGCDTEKRSCMSFSYAPSRLQARIVTADAGHHGTIVAI